MDYDLVFMQINCRNAGVPEHLLEKTDEFRKKHSDYNHSNSACWHLGEGWFILYDFPPAEQWVRECEWNATYYRCSDYNFNKKQNIPNSYSLAHFSDKDGEMHMKLSWC